MPRAETKSVPARFKAGDRVRVKDMPNIFYTRTQVYVRGAVGTVVTRTYEDLIPEDEAWDREDARREQFYIVRFRQKDLWDGYTFENDTLQTEFPDRWLEPALG
jgi:thiocyanate hydrolase subunit beta